MILNEKRIFLSSCPIRHARTRKQLILLCGRFKYIGDLLTDKNNPFTVIQTDFLMDCFCKFQNIYLTVNEYIKSLMNCRNTIVNLSLGLGVLFKYVFILV